MERNLPIVLEEYLNYLNSRKTKSQTAKAYYYDISLYLKYMKNRIYRLEETNIDFIDISDVDIKLLSKISDVDLISYNNYLDKIRQNGGAAKARKASSLKSFYHFIVYIKRYLDRNPYDQLEMPKMAKKATKNIEEISYNDVSELIQGICGKNHLRDKAILLLLLDSSISIQELIHLKLEDFAFENDEINISFHHEDISKIPVRSKTKIALQEYIDQERMNGGCNYLFLSQRKSQISVRTVQHIIKTRTEKNPKWSGKISSTTLRNMNI